MIDSGVIKNQTELAAKLSISRARVSQVLNILRLDEEFISTIEQLGDPMQENIVSICILSKYMKNPDKYEKELMSRLFKDGLK